MPSSHEDPDAHISLLSHSRRSPAIELSSISPHSTGPFSPYLDGPFRSPLVTFAQEPQPHDSGASEIPNTPRPHDAPPAAPSQLTVPLPPITPSASDETPPTPFLPVSNDPSSVPVALAKIKPRLFVSHTLSTLNSRIFEFGAVLFLAEVFRNTLAPMSVYALIKGGSAILGSPWLGKIVDGSKAAGDAKVGRRLRVVRASIGRWEGPRGRATRTSWLIDGLVLLSGSSIRYCGVVRVISATRKLLGEGEYVTKGSSDGRLGRPGLCREARLDPESGCD